MAKIGNSQPKITLPCYEGFLELFMWFESETVSNICQTPLQLANPTQFQLVWVGVDFVFPRKEEGRKEGKKE